jgi:hypothetical protein
VVISFYSIYYINILDRRLSMHDDIFVHNILLVCSVKFSLYHNYNYHSSSFFQSHEGLGLGLCNNTIVHHFCIFNFILFRLVLTVRCMLLVMMIICWLACFSFSSSVLVEIDLARSVSLT